MKMWRIVGGLFGAIGAVLLVVAVVLYQRDRAFSAAARSAPGEVIELARSSSSNYASRIRFVPEGRAPIEFVEGVASSSPRHSVGEQVQVLYDPERPSQAVVDDFWGRRGALAIVGGLGVVFAAIGFGAVAVQTGKRRRDARLRCEGRAIQAEFLRVFVDASLNLNGRNPFRVAAQGSDPVTGLMRNFESAPIWVDPTARLQGRMLTVLLDRQGDGYLVDLSGVVDKSAYA